VSAEEWAHVETPTGCDACGERWPCDAEKMRVERDAAIRRAENAQIVGEYWRDSIMADDGLRATGMSHPVAMVLAALDGETEPVQMGIPPDEYERRAALRSQESQKPPETER
jgi:hypothetical protein